jgi:hypothetical protein
VCLTEKGPLEDRKGRLKEIKDRKWRGVEMETRAQVKKWFLFS